MADEAFALSPINARPSLPTDADYDAIHEAFMETARGRWFLTEYAKRNRNADTRMVLDAVERIETSLASQKQTHAEAAAAAAQAASAQAAAAAKPQIDLWPDLAKAFTRTRMEIAQRLVRESSDEAFEAIRASAEALKSVSWALRERGFDARICDFLDIQVNKITDGYTGLMAENSVAGETEAEILAAFDELMHHVEGLTSSSSAEMDNLDVVVDAIADAMTEDDLAAPMAPDDDEAAVAAPADEPAAAIVDSTRPQVATAFEAVPSISAHPNAEFHEIYGDDSNIEIVDAVPIEEPAPAAPTEPEINKQRLYEAKLEPYRPAASGVEAQEQAVAIAADIEIVDAAGTQAGLALQNPPAADKPVSHAARMTAAQSADQPTEKPVSLGQALIASGVIPNPAGSRPDPLAPFRRMSQAEKVALFT